MNYDLAKKLKDAGFPNIRIGDYFNHTVGSHSDDRGGDSDYLCYCNKDKLPTLSELIEACGPLFNSLHQLGNGKWCADDSRIQKQTHYSGSTPDEAVANLYMALHEKEAK